LAALIEKWGRERLEAAVESIISNRVSKLSAHARGETFADFYLSIPRADD